MQRAMNRHLFQRVAPWQCPKAAWTPVKHSLDHQGVKNLAFCYSRQPPFTHSAEGNVASWFALYWFCYIWQDLQSQFWAKTETSKHFVRISPNFSLIHVSCFMMSWASDISLDLNVWILSTCSWQTQKCHGNHCLLVKWSALGSCKWAEKEQTTEFLEPPADDSQHPNNAPDSSFMKTAPVSQALPDPSFMWKLLKVFLWHKIQMSINSHHQKKKNLNISRFNLSFQM